jgi:hypothetical protein
MRVYVREVNERIGGHRYAEDEARESLRQRHRCRRRSIAYQ